ncbi:MAG: hypoxanthine phosphoribosyltransferase [Acidobacteriota bacterium]|nr:MAG: hypoxanthine phosphoribosyltransferase [Acidobacteriota bacterium]
MLPTLPVLLDEATVRARVNDLARQIRRDAGDGTPVHFVCVLKGAFVFLADLIRACEGPSSCDFLGVASYGDGTSSSGQVRLTKDLDHPLNGRYVVLVEDIVDTGLTLSYLLEILAARQPAVLRTACLLSKPARREVEVTVDYVGFEIEDRFVVGYGLDHAEAWRNLPYIGVMQEQG